MFSFDDDQALSVRNMILKLEAPISKVSKNTDLAFEDIGILKDFMDKKTEVLLIKGEWEVIMNNIKPAFATTCVAINLDFWVSQLNAHLTAGIQSEQLLESLPVICKAVSFIADASAEYYIFGTCLSIG